jgi:Kelch motif
VSAPLPRSGHSAAVFGNLMLIFGGIFEVTKELNDLMAFDLTTKQWITLFEELGPANNSPTRQVTKSFTIDNSPMNKGNAFKQVPSTDILRP